MAGVIMRFSTNPGYKELFPPPGLTPRQRAIWIVAAFTKFVMPTAQQPGLRMALGVAVTSYAQEKNEVSIEQRANLAFQKLLDD